MSCVIVVGCFRSGTSCVAGVLHHLRVPMGEKLQPPNARNPNGYYEDLEFMDFHVKMQDGRLVDMNAYQALIAKREELPLWGVKDPRLCILLSELTRRLTHESKLIQVERPMHEVCCSMARNIGFSEPQTWMPLVDSYLDSLQDNLNSYVGEVLNVSYNELSEHPQEGVERIANFVGVEVTPEAVEFVGCVPNIPAQ